MHAGSYTARIALDSIEVRTRHRTDRIRPTSLSLSSDTTATRAKLASGDLSLAFVSPGPVDSLVPALTRSTDILAQQIRAQSVDMEALKPALPDFSLSVTAGRENILNNFLKTKKVSFGALDIEGVNCDSLPVSLRIKAERLAWGGVVLDTLTAGCRISFQVTSRHDSRTILDQAGAEHLLGRGDMLFKPSGGRLQRLHGPFLSDEEVQNVVGYWKHHLVPSYKVSFADWSADGAAGGSGGGSGAGDVASDPLYAEVQAFVTEQGRVSISLIQRRFKIGFNRAANMVEQLEADGIIGPADGSKPRAVVK